MKPCLFIGYEAQFQKVGEPGKTEVEFLSPAQQNQGLKLCLIIKYKHNYISGMTQFVDWDSQLV